MRRSAKVVFVLLGCGLLSGCPGGGSSSGPRPDFTVTVAPPSVFVAPGTTSAPVTVSVVGQNGFAGPVTMNITGLPTGASTSPTAPFSLNADASQQVMFTVPASTAVGATALTILGSSGTLNRSAGFSLNVSNTPLPTCSLSADPSSISAGQSSRLTWVSANATAATLSPGIGVVGTSGSRIVMPNTTTTYTLTVTNANGNGNCQATVTLSVPPPA